MNRQEILVTAKAKCLRSFSQLLPDLAKRSADGLFTQTGKSSNSAEQRVLLDAYGALVERNSALKLQLEGSLTELINRSIQTAYNPSRPTTTAVASVDSWSLVDSNTIEDEVKLGRVTNRFYEKAGAEIQALNLRIASLFNQDMVKERENPFRPYLFSRCISTAVNRMELTPDARQLLVERLVTELLEGVSEIYKSLNDFFEKNGVTTKLPVKERPARDPLNAAAATRNGSSALAGRAPVGVDFDRPGGSAGDARVPGPAPAEPARPRSHKVEQLLKIIRKKSGPVRGQAGDGAMPHDAGSHGAAYGNGASADPHDGAARMNALRGAGAATGAQAGSGYDGPAGGFSGSGSGGSGGGMGDGWLSGTQIVSDALKKFFAQRAAGATGHAGGSAAGAGGYSAAPFAAPPEGSVYHILNTAKVTTLEDVLGNDGEVRNLIFESRSKLLAKANDGNEMMTIDVVGMIFEFILRDSEVPAEVRAQLGRLQFMMLKIALRDPQLLTEKGHPARKLINEIGTVAQGIKQNDPFGAKLTAEIHRIVEVLLTDESDSMDLISRVLQEFEAFVARELRFGDSRVERAVEAIEEAEKRSIHLARIIAQLREVFTVLPTEPYLQGFIEKTWSKAIENAGLGDPQLGNRYRHLVPELVWSIQEKRTDQERSQLVSLLPKLIFDLRTGMDAVNCGETQAVLGWLIDSHTQAIKAAGKKSNQLPLVSIREQFQGFTGSSASDEASDDSQLAFDYALVGDFIEKLKGRLDGLDFILKFDNDPAEPEAGAIPNRASFMNEDGSVDEESVLERLVAGVAVEVNFDGTPQRAFLNWMSARATNMLLSLEGNDVPTMITVGLFRRLMANGRARFLEVAPLFERAITALMETADQVDEVYE